MKASRMPGLSIACALLLQPGARAEPPPPAPTPAPAPGLRGFDDDPIGVQELVLPNGLTVWLSEYHEVPRFYASVVVRAGAKHDPPAHTGIAHYLEHMLFKGTTRLGTLDYARERPLLEEIERLYQQLEAAPDEAAATRLQAEINRVSLQAARYAVPNELDRLFQTLGCDETNAFTGYDSTQYISSCPASQLERWLTLTAHRFAEPVFRLFPSELETVFEEKNRSTDNPLSYLYESYQARAFPEHPYGTQTVLGDHAHIKRPSLTEMRRYYQRHYVASNMVLVLVGDFDAAQVAALVSDKLGGWPRGEPEAWAATPARPFDGDERLCLFASPLPAGAMGFRVPTQEHPDHPAMRFVYHLLYNEGDTGLINKMDRDKELLLAWHMPVIFHDHALSVIAFAPLPIIQPFFWAEWKIRDKLALVQEGAFPPGQIETIRRNLRAQLMRRWEGDQDRAMAMAAAAARGISWGDYLAEQRRVDAVTREDVIRVARRYYGQGSLTMNSYWGWPPKQRLAKPPFDPVKGADGPSAFFQEVLAIPTSAPAPRFVTFDRDAPSVQLQPGVVLNATPNPANELYSLNIHFGLGHRHVRALHVLGNYLDKVGTARRSADQLKQALHALATTMSFSATDEDFVLGLFGPEAHLAEALHLAGELMASAQAEQDQVGRIKDELRAERSFMLRSGDVLGVLLREYALYGKRSNWVRAPGPRQLDRLRAEGLVDLWQQVQEHAVTLEYAGRQPVAQVARLAAEALPLAGSKRPARPKQIRAWRPHTRDTIYFLPRSDMVQTQLWFMVQGEPVPRAERPAAEAFNAYFGNSMSGLVFQEIRELRSLAYGTYGDYEVAPLPGYPGSLTSYVGCQADKTLEALEVMLGLIKEMPAKPERMEAARTALIEETRAARPPFRHLLREVRDWRRLGYTEDPRREWLEAYPALTFDDVLAFYRRHVAGRPVVVMAVGDPGRVDAAALARFGQVVRVDEDALLSP